MSVKNDILNGSLVRLRALEPEDIDLLYRWENDVDVWKVSNTVAPFSKHTLRRFIENQQCDIYETRQLRLIIETVDDPRPVGAIDLFDVDPYNCRAGIGILIYGDQNEGQGYASQALALLVQYSFMVLMLHQLYCSIAVQNTRSFNLFRSKGFTVVGVKKDWTRTTSNWQDEYMLQLLNPKEV